MATFGEVVYMVLDLVKLRSDDAYFTEEHVMFLASQMRALLLNRKYKGSRGAVYNPTTLSDVQEICVPVQPTEMPTGCSSGWLKSTVPIPKMSDYPQPTASSLNAMVSYAVTMIPMERMPYVGHNKWLKNIIYVALGPDGYLYLHGFTPQSAYVDNIKLQGVFYDAFEAAKLSCDENGEQCDPMKVRFPLDEALLPQCIEMTARMLLGSKYAPSDAKNDARDNLSDIGQLPYNGRGSQRAVTDES